MVRYAPPGHVSWPWPAGGGDADVDDLVCDVRHGACCEIVVVAYGFVQDEWGDAVDAGGIGDIEADRTYVALLGRVASATTGTSQTAGNSRGPFERRDGRQSDTPRDRLMDGSIDGLMTVWRHGDGMVTGVTGDCLSKRRRRGLRYRHRVRRDKRHCLNEADEMCAWK